MLKPWGVLWSSAEVMCRCTTCVPRFFAEDFAAVRTRLHFRRSQVRRHSGRQDEQPTLVALLFNFDLLRQVLVLFPLDFVANRLVVDKVTAIADFFLLPKGISCGSTAREGYAHLVEVSFGELGVTEEIIGGKGEVDFEARLAVFKV